MKLLAGMAQAGRIAYHPRHRVHGGVGAQRRLQRPVAAFVDDDLGTGQILETHGGLQHRELERVGLREPGVPLVRQMRAPQRQIVLPVETAGERRRDHQVVRAEILVERDVHTGGHLVVHVELEARGHDVAPAGGLPLAHMLADLADQSLGQIPQCRLLLLILLRAVNAFEPEGVALAKIVAEVAVAELLEPGRDLRRCRGVEAHHVESLVDGRPEELQQILAVLPELQDVALVGLDTEIDRLARRRPVRRPVGERLAGTVQTPAMLVDARTQEKPARGQLDLGIAHFASVPLLSGLPA